jgi:hypothetical protein
MDADGPWRAGLETGRFWSATLTEFFEAINGHNEAQGAEETAKAPSEDEMAALVAKYG